MPRTWNNGMLILKERYSFINFVVKSEFCPYLNIPFPQTHYFYPVKLLSISLGPLFQHSNCERSELSSSPGCGPFHRGAGRHRRPCKTGDK